MRNDFKDIISEKSEVQTPTPTLTLVCKKEEIRKHAFFSYFNRLKHMDSTSGNEMTQGNTAVLCRKQV